jgi:hypothetical protein
VEHPHRPRLVFLTPSPSSSDVAQLIIAAPQGWESLVTGDARENAQKALASPQFRQQVIDSILSQVKGLQNKDVAYVDGLSISGEDVARSKLDAFSSALD